MGKPEFEAVYNALGKNYNNFPRGNSLIVDVTKSGNGCGGCKTAAMKAGVPEQAMWRTTDGQAWFLRDTAFSEPSGDYTSNCYLGITRVTPTDVQFNDQDCKHGSDDYLCQKEQIAAVLTQGQGRCTCPNGTPKNICMVANAAACASCNPVFKINSNMDQCVDINECATNRGGCDSKRSCQNNAGGFTCADCSTGWANDGAKGCKDIDECAANTDGCHFKRACVNSQGGFTCANCESGWANDGNKNCKDINECKTNNGGCHAQRTCTNTDGSRICGPCYTGWTNFDALNPNTNCTKIIIMSKGNEAGLHLLVSLAVLFFASLC